MALPFSDLAGEVADRWDSGWGCRDPRCRWRATRCSSPAWRACWLKRCDQVHVQRVVIGVAVVDVALDQRIRRLRIGGRGGIAGRCRSADTTRSNKAACSWRPARVRTWPGAVRMNERRRIHVQRAIDLAACASRRSPRSAPSSAPGAARRRCSTVRSTDSAARSDSRSACWWGRTGCSRTHRPGGYTGCAAAPARPPETPAAARRRRWWGIRSGPATAV